MFPILNLCQFQGTSGSSGSAGTAYRLDSQDSTASVDDNSSTWNAGRQTSISLREWDIPYDELVILDKIGSGRFSTGNFNPDMPSTDRSYEPLSYLFQCTKATGTATGPSRS